LTEAGTRARPIPPAGRAFYAINFASSLAVGALQMFRVRGGFLTSYGADIFGTAWLYAMFRQGRTVFQRGRTLPPGAAALGVFAGCAASEFGQRWHVIPGTFDPYDLAAFGASVGLCWLIDRRYGPLA
jgi:hypothetical protein